MLHKTRHAEINAEIIELLKAKLSPGQPVTEGIWNSAYKLVQTRHALSTIEMKHRILIGEKI